MFPQIRTVAEPFTRLFTRYELKPFDLRRTAEQIQKPLDVEKILLKLPKSAIKEIHEITSGHPFFISLAMKHFIDRIPEGTVSADKFTAFCPDIREYFSRSQVQCRF